MTRNTGQPPANTQQRTEALSSTSPKNMNPINNQGKEESVLPLVSFQMRPNLDGHLDYSLNRNPTIEDPEPGWKK